jgi:predicted O-linked N-acetylglucosamine transferase (SPINDLY family)/glycosyltransferase involved in cell wall biosynthesis
MKCHICNSASQEFSTATLLCKYKVTYFQCTECGFVQTEAPYWLEEAYTEAIAGSDVGIIRRNLMFSEITGNIILNCFRHEAKFLDYGGGYGLLVRMMRDLGFDYYWQDKFCKNFFAKGLEADERPDLSYELVSAFEVFEHLTQPTDEVSQMLRFSKNILFSTELLPVNNPKPTEWWYYSLHEGQHISIYTYKSLLKLAERFNLNLYSNGSSLHLLTQKEISSNFFQKLCLYKPPSIGRESLIQRDYLTVINKIKDPTPIIFENSIDLDKNVSRQALKIVIDAIFFQIIKTGIARIWECLLEEWAVNGFARHIVVLDRNGTAPIIPGIRYRSIPLYDANNVVADRQLLQQICDEENATLFASTYYTTPLTTPSVFMAYDMIPEVMGYDLSDRMWQEKHFCIQQASTYLAISRSTAHDLVKYFPHIDLNSVTVAHCGIENTLKPASLNEINHFKSRFGISKPYFLLVGIRTGYKNAIQFFRAFAQLSNRHEFSVVCVGRQPLLEAEFQPYTSGCTVHTLSLNDDDLRAAYSGATALVYPSKYEGFGLPILEAMACGCPVITSSHSSIPEVAGDAALYVNNEIEMLEALYKIQQDNLRDALIAAGLNQSQQFSWTKMAEIVSATFSSATNLPIQPSAGLPRFLIQIPKLIEQYQTNPASSDLLDRLHQARQQLVEYLLALPIAALPQTYAEGLGQVYRAILHSALQAYPLSQAEQSQLDAALHLFAQHSIAQDLSEPNALPHLIVAMLYQPAHQLPLPVDLTAIPQWFLPDYLPYLLAPPSIFAVVGTHDRYYHYLKQWVDYLHTQILAHSAEPYWQLAAQLFTRSAQFGSLYFTTQNLKQIYCKRADIMTTALVQQGHAIDYEFPDRSPDRDRIRLGILAAHFQPATETFATLPIFKHLDRERFEIILFAVSSHPHRLENYCAGHADAFVVLPNELAVQVKMMRQADLDILFIATNTTFITNQITLLSLHRLARVQVTGMNSPTTTGMPHLDYYISSSLVDAAYDAQSHYCETLIQLDCPAQCFDFATEAFARPTLQVSRSQLDIPSDAVVYTSGANFHKITPELEDTWARIIAEVPHAILLLYPFNPYWSATYPVQAFVQRLTDTFARHGLGCDRFRILEATPHQVEVIARLKLADIYLDAFPFSGMTSLIDPLKLAMPTLVMEMDSACSLARGAAFLRDLNRSELIAPNPEEYVARAVALGKYAEKRQQLQQQIQTAMQSRPRFLDSYDYSTRMGEVFQQIFDQYCDVSFQQTYRLRQLNFIAFPDWQQPDELILEDLTNLLRNILTHVDRSYLTLLINIDGIEEEQANDYISSVVMYLLTEEELEINSEEPEITLVSSLNPLQWQQLLRHLSAPIRLERENILAVQQLERAMAAAIQTHSLIS